MLIHQISGYNVTYKTVIELIENSLRIEITSTVIMIPITLQQELHHQHKACQSIMDMLTYRLIMINTDAPPQINDTNPHSIEGDSVELSSLTLLSL